MIEPLREDWTHVQGAAETRRAAGDLAGAAAEVKAFHDKLCDTRVLDPACGTANFLYVALELMKKLEGEVLEGLAGLTAQSQFAGYELRTIDPHQFLGLEINPRAAAIAELVLWIGYLQWHFRTRGGIPPEPILRAFRNIEIKNAVLTWDGYPLPGIKGRQETYPNPRRPIWPMAEFIVGNPPFIGGKDLRARLGDAYAQALWAAHTHINESADLVMYWWDRAAEMLAAKGSPLRRFGFVTTNSVTQEFSRRVMKKRLEGKTPISLVMAIPDHPWTKATPNAAAVRIAMTVAERGEREGVLQEVVGERELDTDQPEIEFAASTGRVNADLTVGTDVTAVAALLANEGMCSPGMKLHGSGFIVTPQQANRLGLGRRPGLERHIREYRNGRDLTSSPRGVMVIDLFGLTADEVRQRYPEVYQHIVQEVKEKKDCDGKMVGRDANNRETYRTNWWIFGEPRSELRPALEQLPRYIATVETTRHRVLQFVSAEVIPDNMLVCIASQDAWHLGVLSSRIHVVWALRAGGWLGVGNDPRYSKSKVFDPFPFPDPAEPLKADIRVVAEELDAFRKERQAEHPRLTLTQIYNVLEKLKADMLLGAADERIKEQGLVLILKELHERLDRLVFQAYGWPEALSDEAILAHLVALNRERVAEEARGLVRWLRPDYQIPRFGRPADKQAAAEEGTQLSATLHLIAPKQKPAFPASELAQTAAVFAMLAAGPLDARTVALRFRQGKRIEPKIKAVLESLVRLGHVATRDGRTFVLRRAA